jgi:hypothetical protein
MPAEVRSVSGSERPISAVKHSGHSCRCPGGRPCRGSLTPSLPLPRFWRGFLPRCQFERRRPDDKPMDTHTERSRWKRDVLAFEPWP